MFRSNEDEKLLSAFFYFFEMNTSKINKFPLFEQI